MKTKEQIIQWYKDNGYYEELNEEILRQHSRTLEEYIADKKVNFSIMRGLLNWAESARGYSYWLNVNQHFVYWFESKPTQPAPTKQIDWEQRRYEIAREIYLRLIFAPQENLVFTPKAKAHAVSAVELAEILINELKKNKEEQS